MRLIAWVFSPTLFGLAFLGPLLSQSAIALDIAPDTITTLVVSLLVGTGWGLLAQRRGSWIWIKP